MQLVGTKVAGAGAVRGGVGLAGLAGPGATIDLAPLSAMMLDGHLKLLPLETIALDNRPRLVTNTPVL